MNKKNYMGLHFKRCFKVYVPILSITVMVSFVFLVTASAIVNHYNNGSKYASVKIGVVGDVEGSYLGIGIEAVKKLDTSRFYIDFINYSEAQAKSACQKGKISGYVHIPPNFIDDVTSGKNVSVKYVSSGKGGAINKLIEQEVISSVSNLVKETQKNIYGAIDIGKDYKQKDIHKKVNKLNLSYISSVLNREKVAELKLVGVSNELGYRKYYLCAIIVFFLCIWGISCNRVICSGDIWFLRLLNSCGIGAFRQIFTSGFCFFTLTVLTLAIFALGAGLCGGDVILAFIFIIKLLPVILMFVFMHLMLCEVLNGIGGVLVQFVIALVQGYLSGLFYPVSFFPYNMQIVSACLPCGAGFSYVQKLISCGEFTQDITFVLVYAVLFFAICVAIRKHKIIGDKVI